MEKLHFSIRINAAPEKVWQVLWGDDTYPAWTASFAEGSRAETDWQEGSKVLFLDGKNDGMVSRIDRMVPMEFMSFVHLGEIRNGVEDTTSDKVKAWTGGHEDYTLKNAGDHTVLDVDMDMSDEFREYFLNAWPKATEKIKALSEQA